jgi:hypothetical protein
VVEPMPAKVVTHIRVAKKSDVTLLNFDFIIAFPPVKIEKHTVSLRCAFVDFLLRQDLPAEKQMRIFR